jgi:hypothetical protein
MSIISTGDVYFIKAEGVNPIKNGHTFNLNRRLEQIKTYLPTNIEIVGLIHDKNPAKIEREIHKELKDYRMNGEWFNISESMANKIIEKYSELQPLILVFFNIGNNNIYITSTNYIDNVIRYYGDIEIIGYLNLRKKYHL